MRMKLPLKGQYDQITLISLLFFFLIRMIGITNPPLELSHNWRQSMTNMISRNFVEEGFNFFYPKVDIAGNFTGIIGSEAPFYNFLIYAISSVFGFEHWYGRIISLVVASIGSWFFYKLLSEVFSKKLASYTVIVLTTSLWFLFSRNIMPDTFSISLMFMALYFCHQYLKSGRILSFILFFLLAFIAIGSKLPAIGWLSVLVVLFWKPYPTHRKIWVLATSGFVALCAYVWYFVWAKHLVKTYKFQLFLPKALSEGIAEILGLLPELASQFYFSAFCSFVAFGVMCYGLFLWFKNAPKSYLITTGVIALTYTVFIVKTGEVFPTHNYYMIPIVPFMAILAGYGLAHIPPKWAAFLLVVAFVESFANQQHNMFVKDSNLYMLELEELSDRYVTKDELVIVNGGYSPQMMYFANKRGWTYFGNWTESFVDSIVSEGATKMIIDKHRLIEFEPSDNLLFENDDFRIYDLAPANSNAPSIQKVTSFGSANSPALSRL